MQDRLVPEFRLNKITKIKDANDYLINQFLPNYWNKKLTLKPASDESAYSKPDPMINLDDIFCLETMRKIGRDQTISWRGDRYQIVEKHGYDLRGYMAVIRTYQNRSTKVFVAGAEVGIRKAPKTLQKGPYELKIEANMSLVPDFSVVSKTHLDQEREKAILKIYGSKETYYKHGNPKVLPPSSYWSILEK